MGLIIIMKKLNQISLNKKAILIFGMVFTSSCANIALLPSNTSSYVENSKALFSTVKILFTGDDANRFFKNNHSSFAIARLDNGGYIKLKLNNIDEIKKWGGEFENISTYHGKVLSTYGLENNLNIYNYYSIKDFFKSNQPKEQFISYYSFSNPEAKLLASTIELNRVKKTSIELLNGQAIEATLISEKIYIESLSLSFNNFYWVSKDGTTLRTKQQITPHNKLRIEFYY